MKKRDCIFQKLKEILFYLSAFLPMFYINTVKDYLSFSSNVWKQKGKLKDFFNPQLTIVFVIILIITIVAFTVFSNNKKISTDLVVINKVTNKTAEYYLAYFSLFVLELFTFSFLKWIDIVVMILLLLVLGVVYIRNGLFFINPTLNLFRSYIFEVEYESDNTVKTKIVICKDKIKPNDSLYIDISDYDFSLARKEKNESDN